MKPVSYQTSARNWIQRLLLVACFTAFETRADCPCLTQALSADTKVLVPMADLQLEHAVKKDTKLPGAKVRPLADAFELSEPFIHPVSGEGSSEFTKAVELPSSDGRRYRIEQGTRFTYPPDDLKVSIPSGTSLSKTSEGYVLAEGVTVDVQRIDNYELVVTIPAQTIVERIPQMASLGGTLDIEPKRVPDGGMVKLLLEKSGFDFSKSQFYVCVREGEGMPYHQSEDVNLNALEMGKAVLLARVPEKMYKGVHFAKKVELLVVAQEPSGGKMVEVISHELSIPSRWNAAILWIVAFLGALGIAATSRRVISKINDTEPKPWSNCINPIAFAAGKYGGASLSLAQIFLWTLLVFSASFYVFAISGKLMDISDQILILLGITGGSSVIAKISASAKSEQGSALLNTMEHETRWTDLFQTDGRPDLYKLQMALFTTLAAVFVFVRIANTLEFPVLPAGLLTLIGVSNGVYLGAKISSNKKPTDTVAELEKEMKKAEAKVGELKQKIANAEEEKETPEDTVAELKKEMEKAEAKVEELKQKIANAKEENETPEGTVAELEKEMEEANVTVEELKQKIAAAEEHARKVATGATAGSVASVTGSGPSAIGAAQPEELAKMKNQMESAEAWQEKVQAELDRFKQMATQ